MTFGERLVSVMSTVIRPAKLLTRRGQIFLAVGVFCVLVAFVLGRRDVLYLSCFVLVLPVLACFAVRTRRGNFTVERRLAHAPALEGGTSTVQLSIQSHERVAASTMMETLPSSIGTSPRFQYPSVSSHGAAVSLYEYGISPPHRGTFTLGGAVAEFQDPLGMAWQRHTIDPGTPITAIPGPVEDVSALLHGVLGHQSSLRSGDAGAAFSLVASEQDVMTRQYRPGDSIRRIHWASTARHQEIMVRQEEGVAAPRVTLILDTRMSAHNRFTGYPAPLAARTLATTVGFEWVIHTVHSVTTALAHAGQSTVLTTEQGLTLGGQTSASHASPQAWMPELSLTLATLELSTDTAFTPYPGESGPLLAFLGALSSDEARHLAGVAVHHDGPATAVLCAPTELSDGVVPVLEKAGWHVIRATPDTSASTLGTAAAEAEVSS